MDRVIIIFFPYNNLRVCRERSSVTYTEDVTSRYEGMHDADHAIEKRASCPFCLGSGLERMRDRRSRVSLGVHRAAAGCDASDKQVGAAGQSRARRARQCAKLDLRGTNLSFLVMHIG